MWLWGIADVEYPEDVRKGYDIDEFLRVSALRNSIMYFHNLKYDGHFIIDRLLKTGYKHIVGKQGLEPGQFRTLISDMNKFYSINVRWTNGKTMEFRDSLKKIPLTLAGVAKAFKLPESKGELDYKKYRPIGYRPTDEEIEYLNTDVTILARAIKVVLDNGMKKLTVGADALAEYKELTGKKFDSAFPVLSDEMDSEIRRAYRGGFTYADPRFSGRKLETGGVVLDVNSLYPSVMKDRILPYGEPEFARGLPQTSKKYPLSIFTVTFTAKVKPGHIPCIQIKGHYQFLGTEYLTEVKEPTTITITNIDWQLFQDHYDIDVWEYGGGWLFKGTAGFFDSYIDKWMEVKANSEGGQREIAKLHLNSLYGKFATNPNVTGKYPELNEKGAVIFVRGEDEMRAPVYTAMGVFITAYARDLTIRAAQENYDVFAYADTDSLHLLTKKVPDTIDVHPSRLGAWKFEYEFMAAFYVRAKVYLEQKHDGSYVNAFAGLPERVSTTLTFDDLRPGRVFTGKLTPQSVPGGVVLKDIDFKLNM